MKITHDRSKCIGCGVCAALCPEYFEMEGDKAHLRGSKIAPGTEIEELEVENVAECVGEAVDACPVQCIKIVKRK